MRGTVEMLATESGTTPSTRASPTLKRAMRRSVSGVYTPETLRRIARLSVGLARVDGVVPDSVASISTVPRITLVDGQVDTSPLYRPEDQLNTATIQQLRRDVGRRGYDTGILISRDGKGAAIIAKVEPGADRYRLPA